ncbi:hypothetical protein FIV37_10160 [Pseudomonas gessardii]|nr:hypothetical protein [Pseudomonas gessardii]
MRSTSSRKSCSTKHDTASTVETGPCGSGLARDCGISVNLSVADLPSSRASPLPHGSRQALVDPRHL